MDQEQILAKITAMVDDERRLRDAVASGQIDSATEHERLGQLERELDQCSGPAAPAAREVRVRGEPGRGARTTVFAGRGLSELIVKGRPGSPGRSRVSGPTSTALGPTGAPGKVRGSTTRSSTGRSPSGRRAAGRWSTKCTAQPSAAAPPSARRSSPTISVSSGAMPSASQAVANSRGSGFWMPCSYDRTYAPTYRSRPCSRKTGPQIPADVAYYPDGDPALAQGVEDPSAVSAGLHAARSM